MLQTVINCYLHFHQVNVGIALLSTVRNDLQNVIAVCEQVKKPTNYLRSVMSDLMKGTVVFYVNSTEILLPYKSVRGHKVKTVSSPNIQHFC